MGLCILGPHVRQTGRITWAVIILILLLVQFLVLPVRRLVLLALGHVRFLAHVLFPAHAQAPVEAAAQLITPIIFTGVITIDV